MPGRAERWLVGALATAPDAVDAATTAGVLVAADGTLTFRHELARLSVEAELGDGPASSCTAGRSPCCAGRIDPGRVAHHAGPAGDDDVLAEASVAACRRRRPQRPPRGDPPRRTGTVALRQLEPATVADVQAALAPVYVAVALGRRRSRGQPGRRAPPPPPATAPGGGGADPAELGAVVDRADRGERRDGHARRDGARAPPGGRRAGPAYLRVGAAHMLARERDLAVCWGDRSIALAAELDDQPVLGRALVQRGIADVMDGRHDEGMAFIEQGIALGRRLDLPSVVALGLLQIGSGCGEMRRYDVAVPALEEGVVYTTTSTTSRRTTAT